MEPAAPAAPSSASPAVESKPSASSSSPEKPMALATLLAELQLEQVVRTLWRGNSHQPVKLQLTPAHCVVEGSGPKPQTLSLSWSDVLGAHVLTADGEHVQTPLDVDTVDRNANFLLGIFACVCKHHKPGTLRKRRLSEFFFRFSGQQMQQVLQLQRLINFVADPRNQKTVEAVESLETLKIEDRSPRKFLVLVNPVSGAGTCEKI
ncbi:unnamed protein product [Phytophthora lilii]|uniref:Unnamed protein product n=1 Tax=Phytophthora lilii TaxID=2077276 RepID=A0A9W6TTK3_9STRA|nr:unnamed protein product [Phytophthora lilii]